MKSFLSSTYIDLVEHRNEATKALERLGTHVDRMEVFGARPEEPQQACLTAIEDCDVFIGLYAHRYGYIPQGASSSITEQEFDHARQRNKRCFCFLIDEDHPWPPKMIEGEPNSVKLRAFKESIRTALVSDSFTTPQDLAVKIATSVGHHLAQARQKIAASAGRSRTRQEATRENVAQYISYVQIGQAKGDHYLSFERDFTQSESARARFLKLLLAFANAPRNRDAYIIYGFAPDEEDNYTHIGCQVFPSGGSLEKLINDYTELKDFTVDTDFVLDGKSTPYVVLPLQYDGPYRLRQALSGARKIIDPKVVYLRAGSQIVTAGELERRKMQDWSQWFWDGRYIQSLDELETIVKRTFPQLKTLERVGEYVRFTLLHTSSDNMGERTHWVLGHAYPGLNLLGDDKIERLRADNLSTIHERWLVCHGISSSAARLIEESAIRVLTIDALFLANDVYARYCRAYLDQWKSDRDATKIYNVIDLDFKQFGSNSRESSVLSWLESAFQGDVSAPTVLSSEFGTGKSVTLRQLVANVCTDYLRRSNEQRLIYVDLNSIDLRAERQSFVETALLSLPLSRPDIDELIRMVDADKISLILDSVDEMARPYSMSGRKEAFRLLRQNLNGRPSVLAVRPNYFADRKETLERIEELGHYDLKTGQKIYRVAELCELTDIQIEELVSAGLAEREEGRDAKRVVRDLVQQGLGTFLKDPLVLALTIARLRAADGVLHFEGYQGRVTLISKLLEDIVQREVNKRRKHAGHLRPEQFHDLLTWLAFRMASGESRSFGIPQIENFVQKKFQKEVTDSQLIASEMAEQFRTQTWLHIEGDNYRFRHEVLIQVLAAQYILRSIEREDYENLQDWNPRSVNAEAVVAAVRELVEPRQVVIAAAALAPGAVTAPVRTLILEMLRNLNAVFESKVRPAWLSDQQIDDLLLQRLGRAIKASTNELDAAGAVLSCVAPSIGRSSAALNAALCFLVLARQRTGDGGPEVFRQIQRVVEKLSDLRTPQGHGKKFEDMLKDLKDESAIREILLKAAGISTKGVADPFSYEPLFSELMQRLPDSTPLGRYVKHAAQYLKSHVDSRSRR